MRIGQEKNESKFLLKMHYLFLTMKLLTADLSQLHSNFEKVNVFSCFLYTDDLSNIAVSFKYYTLHNVSMGK